MNDECPLVIIRWQDSGQPIPAWQHLSALNPAKAIECATVGWLLRDDGETKVVCQSVGDLQNPANAQASGIMTIPTRCVISIDGLSEYRQATALRDPQELYRECSAAVELGGCNTHRRPEGSTEVEVAASDDPVLASKPKQPESALPQE